MQGCTRDHHTIVEVQPYHERWSHVSHSREWPRAVMPAAARMGTQLAIAPAALRVAATASRAARAIRPLSLAIVTKRKPMPIIRAA